MDGLRTDLPRQITLPADSDSDSDPDSDFASPSTFHNLIWRASRRGRGGVFDLAMELGWGNALIPNFFGEIPFSADQGCCWDHSNPQDNLSFQTFVSSRLPSCPFTFPFPFPSSPSGLGGLSWWPSTVSNTLCPLVPGIFHLKQLKNWQQET